MYTIALTGSDLWDSLHVEEVRGSRRSTHPRNNACREGHSWQTSLSCDWPFEEAEQWKQVAPPCASIFQQARKCLENASVPFPGLLQVALSVVRAPDEFLHIRRAQCTQIAFEKV